jgi:hypothetical protein
MYLKDSGLKKRIPIKHIIIQAYNFMASYPIKGNENGKKVGSIPDELTAITILSNDAMEVINTTHRM